MHTDVGGGYETHKLSDIPLVWMRDMAVNSGLCIYADNSVSIDGDVNGRMHDSRGEGWTKLFRKKQRGWDSLRSDKPVIHSSVLKRTKNCSNGSSPVYQSWILDLEHEIEN